jgi:hypothetical protein
MAQHQLRQTDEALATLAKGLEFADAKLPKLDTGGWLDEQWNDWIIAHLLMRESQALIKPGSEPQ